MPIFYVYSKKNCLVHLKHSEVIKDSMERNIEMKKNDSHYDNINLQDYYNDSQENDFNAIE